MSDGAGPVLRRLVARDIPAAVGLSEQAGWNQTSEDWRTLIDLAPEGCLAIEVGGELAATTTLLCYGQRLAWIGMVLTNVSYRGRGFARRLLTEALMQADQMRIETVKLDATDQGRPLYEKMGFRFEQVVERWSRPAANNSSGTVVLVDAPPAENWRKADLRSFGADRSDLLERLAQRSQPPLFIEGSYLLTRPGRQTRYLGPSVCNAPKLPVLLSHTRCRPNGPPAGPGICCQRTLTPPPLRGISHSLRPDSYSAWSGEKSCARKKK